MYILEHIYRWLSGQAPHLLEPGLFYPYQDTIFFSDTQAGTALIYSTFRTLGASQYLAFDLWFFSGYLTTYIAAHYAFARMGSGAVAAGIGGLVFAFSLPSLAQFAHCQLVYRCGVPLAVLYLYEGLRENSARRLVLSAFWLCIQTLISVYIGVFLCELMAALALPLLWSLWRPLGWSTNARLIAEDLLRLVRAPSRSELALLLATTGVGLATGLLLWGYSHTSQIYGLVRSWAEVKNMLPQPGSYFVMDGLSYWHDLVAPLSGTIQRREEHQMFMGIGVAVLFLSGIIALIVRPKAVHDLPAQAMLLALAILVLATMNIHGRSPYALLVHLPGINAIRAVSRIINVLMFPVALVAVLGVQALVEQVRPAALGKIAVLICLFGIFYDMMALSRLEFSASEAKLRVDSLVAEALRAQGGIANPILAVVGQDGDLTHLDAEMAAQELNWPTINGYSGSSPAGSWGQPNCSYVMRHLAGAELWSKKHEFPDPFSSADVYRRIVFVGWPDCRASPNALPSLHIGTPPTNELPKKVALTAGAIQRRDNLISFVVHVHNASDEPMSVISTAPIRVSWRFLPITATGALTDRGWDSSRPYNNMRDALAADIAPGGEQDLVLTDKLPREPGRYRLQVSLVAEGLYWFHDKGMNILSFPDPMIVP